MTPTSILVTLLFVLADGRPAKNADVRCTGVPVYAAGDDEQKRRPDGTSLIVDRRGAVIVFLEPRTITCDAKFDVYHWTGPIALKRHGQVTTIRMASY